jgi:single-stranded DNA-binding protein
MLDGRSTGGGESYDNNDNFGSSSPSSAPRERKPAMAGSGKRDDMDDEIPF